MNKSNVTQTHHTARWARNLLREVRFTWAALAIGSQTVPLADNRQLVRDLAARASRLYGADPAKRTGEPS